MGITSKRAIVSLMLWRDVTFRYGALCFELVTDGLLAGHKLLAFGTLCQGCLRNFFTVIQNKPLDFVAHGFFARFAEIDFDAIGGFSDFLYHNRLRDVQKSRLLRRLSLCPHWQVHSRLPVSLKSVFPLARSLLRKR